MQERDLGVDRGDHDTGRDALAVLQRDPADAAGAGVDPGDRRVAACASGEALQSAHEGVGQGARATDGMPLPEEVVGGLPVGEETAGRRGGRGGGMGGECRDRPPREI